jgi:hypothetical protein
MRDVKDIQFNCYVWLMFILIMVTGFIVSAAHAQTLNAPLMNEAPNTVNIDGVITGNEWINAGATARIFSLPDRGGINRDVTVYALHDNNNLYLGFIVNDHTRSDLPVGMKDDGIILLFDPGTGATPDRSATVLMDDIGYSYFVVPNTSTASLTDATVTGNNHSPVIPVNGQWSTAQGMPAGVYAQFLNVNPGTGEQGWQMEIMIPFTALNNIDPHAHNQIGFAFFIVNDWGDTDVDGAIGEDDYDGFLAYPPALANGIVVPGSVISPLKSVSSLINTGNFKNPSSWETITLIRPQIVATQSFHFPITAVNTTSTLPLTIQNNGGTNLTYTLNALPAPFSYAPGTPTSEQTLNAGGSVTYQVQFTPTGEGVVPAQTQTITSNDQNVDITLNGEGGLPHIAITNASSGVLPTLTLNFGIVTINTSKSIDLMIGNTGTIPLNVTNITKTGSGIVTGPNLSSPVNHLDNIVSGFPKALTITCTPTSVGTFSATIKFDTDDPAYQIGGTGNDITINVTCEGVMREAVLLLDASGSMRLSNAEGVWYGDINTRRWKQLEQGVSLFTEVLVQHGENTGTFNGVLFPNKDFTAYTGTVFPNMVTINASNKTIFDNYISSVQLNLNGLTPLGAGLQAAVNQFTIPNSKRALILFSDGANNEGPAPSNFYTAATNSHARIYTIGYGVPGAMEVNLDLLDEIADLTEQPGEENAFSVNSVASFDLFNTFKYILEDDLGLDLVVDPEGTISAGQQLVREITVSDMAQQLYFYVSWNTYQTNRLRVELITPDCQLITPSTAVSDARVRYLSKQKFQIYTIKSSLVKSGKWKVIVHAPDTLSTGEPFSYGLMADTRLQLDPIFSKSTYFTGDEIMIKAVLRANGVPMKGATVSMTMKSPQASLSNWLALNYVFPQFMKSVSVPGLDSPLKVGLQAATFDTTKKLPVVAAPAALDFDVSAPLAKKAYILKNIFGITPPLETKTAYLNMYDDGVTGGDEVANDGVYTATVKNTTVAGTYNFQIDANGKTPGGYDFTREAHTKRLVNAGWSIGNIHLQYDYAKQLINERYRDVMVVSIYGKDAFGNVSVSDQNIKDLHINVANDSLWGGIRNNYDGSYSQTIILADPKKSPKISVRYKDQPLTKDYEFPIASDLTFMDTVINYKAGKEGKTGFNAYTKPVAALGAPAQNRFISLGDSGDITVAMKGKEIYDGPGPDIFVYETANLPNQFETPDSYSVEVLTKDGYVNLGTVQGGTAQFDLADKGITQATAVRIVDASRRIANYSGAWIHTPGADIEAVGAKYVRDIAPECIWLKYIVPDFFAGSFIFDKGLGLQNGFIVGARLGYRSPLDITGELEGGVTFAKTTDGKSGTLTQLLINGRYTVKSLQVSEMWMKPYVTVGAGYMFFRGFGINSNEGVRQLGVGTTLEIKPSLGVRLDVRYFSIGNITTPKNNVQTTAGLMFWF